ncbi:hypothetical protein BV20DRAFT_146296 [Pilatotrama ljubarskyi]|nr:hypothetical protein BV20DRAFT_146296 [Pilatotrama ljubarskyi]
MHTTFLNTSLARTAFRGVAERDIVLSRVIRHLLHQRSLVRFCRLNAAVTVSTGEMEAPAVNPGRRASKEHASHPTTCRWNRRPSVGEVNKLDRGCVRLLDEENKATVQQQQQLDLYRPDIELTRDTVVRVGTRTAQARVQSDASWGMHRCARTNSGKACGCRSKRLELCIYGPALMHIHEGT